MKGKNITEGANGRGLEMEWTGAGGEEGKGEQGEGNGVMVVVGSEGERKGCTWDIRKGPQHDRA